MSQILFLTLLCLHREVVQATLFVTEINESTFIRDNISVIHNCFFGHSLCAQLSLKISSLKFKEIYQDPSCLECNDFLRRSKDNTQETFQSTLPLIIKDEYLCRPDYWEKNPLFILSSKLTVFIIQTRFVRNSSRRFLIKRKEFIKQQIEYDVVVPPPYSRKKCISRNNVCTSVYHTFMHLTFSESFHFFQSPQVQVPFPLATNVFVSLRQMGQYIFFPENKRNSYFRKFFLSNSKRFTLSLWIYLYSNCSLKYCNIISFFNDITEGFTSPVILLKDNGMLHIQSLLVNSMGNTAFITNFNVPLRSWCQLIFSIGRSEWFITLASKDGNILGKSSNLKFLSQIDLDLKKGFGVIGGSQIYAGVDAYISDVYLYPGELLSHNTIIQSRKTVSFTSLQLTNLDQTKICVTLTEELNHYRNIINQRSSREMDKYTCKPRHIGYYHLEELKCLPRKKDLRRPRLFSFIERLFINSTEITEESKIMKEANTAIGTFLFERSLRHIKKKGIDVGPLVLKYLEESNCLEHSEATYILAALNFYGIGVTKLNATKALELLLVNVLKSEHRLSLLALGNMHKFNFLPLMESLSAVYYKTVADLAAKDIHNLENGDMFNDRIRLTNEAEIKEHTDENEDLFYWIKHQAEAGIPWAKQRLGRIFYWGSQGIQRNFNQAVNYFRLAAEGPGAQAENHFDYGLVLVKNSNKKEDIDEGTAQLEKASEKDPRALTVLGWLAESRDKNYKLAFDYYLKAHNLGNADATYNIGVFYHTGRLPGLPMDKKKAFTYFTKAALKNQLNSGSMYSHYQMTGISGFLERNITMAINWARFIGEQNPRVGFYLSEGVRAYRKRKIELSVFYYLMASFAGLELANFNAAILCEEYESLVKKYVEKECIWYHYNLSIQREEHLIHAYSLVKMGDKNWYGCDGSPRNITIAAEFYLRAALKREPQAYFNLAYILEHGEVDINPMLIGKLIWSSEKDKTDSFEEWKYKSIIQLYQKCEDLSEHNTYLPCKLASQRLSIVHMWEKLKIKAQTILAIVLTIIIIYKFIKLWFYNSHNDNGHSQ